MSIRSARLYAPAILAFGAIVALAACTATDSPTASGSAGPQEPVVSSPGEALGSLPGVEGFSYRAEDRAARGFLAGANETLAGDAAVEINQSAIATRGSDEVSLISFGFPGAADADAIDYFARVLDDMEDGFQAGSQRGLGGGAYVMSANGESVVLAPWGRAQGSGNLVFLFALGPTGITEQLAAAILGVEG
jgi:hypothetical protein